MKRNHKTAGERLQLPEETLSNVPLTELHGRNLACVENHCGIVEYTPELVRIAVRRGSVSIRGCGLTIAKMTRRRVEVRGSVVCVELD